MANFCGACGSPLDQSTGLCPKCSPNAQNTAPVNFIPLQVNAPDAQQKTVVADNNVVSATPEATPVASAATKTETPTYEADAPASPVYNNETQPEAVKAPKAKSPKKKLIAIVSLALAAIILVGGAVTGFLILSKDKGYPVAGESYLIESKYGIFYQTGRGVVNLNNVEAGMISDDLTELRLWEKTVCVDDEIYTMPGNECNIYKAEIEGETEVDIEVWMDDGELADQLWNTDGLFEDVEIKYRSYLQTMNDWQYSDDYIYFTLRSDLEYVASGLGDAAYRIARINIEDKKLEVYDGDIRATSYAVDGKWIYYCDSGFVYEGNGEYRYDKSKAGIYKVKIDGTDKEKLLDVDATDENWENFRQNAGYTNISIYKNKIYFIDNSEPFESRICRMKKNGKDMEEVSSTTSHEYTIDTKRNRLYYIDGSYAISNGRYPSHELIEVNLKNLEEKTIADIGTGAPNNFFQIICHDSVLYFHSFYKGLLSPGFAKPDENNTFLVGLYYDLKKEEATGIYAEYIYGEPTETVLPGGRVHQQPGILEKVNYFAKEYETTKLIEFK